MRGDSTDAIRREFPDQVVMHRLPPSNVRHPSHVTHGVPHEVARVLPPTPATGSSAILKYFPAILLMILQDHINCFYHKTFMDDTDVNNTESKVECLKHKSGK